MPFTASISSELKSVFLLSVDTKAQLLLKSSQIHHLDLDHYSRRCDISKVVEIGNR